MQCPPVLMTSCFFGYVANHNISNSVILRSGFAWDLDEAIKYNLLYELRLCYHLIFSFLKVNDLFKV